MKNIRTLQRKFKAGDLVKLIKLPPKKVIPLSFVGLVGTVMNLIFEVDKDRFTGVSFYITGKEEYTVWYWIPNKCLKLVRRARVT